MSQERVDQLVELLETIYTVNVLIKLASRIGLVNARDYTVADLRKMMARFMIDRDIEIPAEFLTINKADNRKHIVPGTDMVRPGRNRYLARDIREVNQSIVDYLKEGGVEWNVSFNDQVRDDISSMFLISPPEVTGLNRAIELVLDGKKKMLRKSEWWKKECFVETRREELADLLEIIISVYKELNTGVVKFKLWQDLLITKDTEVFTVYTIDVDDGANCSTVVNYDENELRNLIDTQINNLISYYEGDAMIKAAGSGFVIDSYSPVNLQLIDVKHGEDSYALKSFQPFPVALSKRKGLINVQQKENDWSTDQCFMMNMAVWHYHKDCLKHMEVKGGYTYEPHAVNGIKPYVESFKKYNNMKKYDEFIRKFYPGATVNIFLYKEKKIKEGTKTVVAEMQMF